jgi:hypothetical protein
MTPTNHSSDRKLEQANKKHARSTKRQVYIADKDSASDISSSHSDDREHDTDALVEVYHLSTESIRNPTLVNGLQILVPRHICLPNFIIQELHMNQYVNN